MANYVLRAGLPKSRFVNEAILKCIDRVDVRVACSCALIRCGGVRASENAQWAKSKDVYYLALYGQVLPTAAVTKTGGRETHS